MQVAIVLHNSDDSFHYRLEARVDLKATPLEPIEARDLALDFLDWYLGEYLDAGRDLFLPLDWEPYSFGEHEVQARGEIRNLKLEAQADDLLAGRVRAEDLGRPSAGSEESEDPAEPGGDA